MDGDIKHVFISHVHEDDDGLGKLKDLVSRAGLTIRDSSINSTNPNDANHPDYIKSGILAPQIRWASTFLVYITPKTKNSEWVNWEIEYAEKQGKRIVGVYPSDQTLLNEYALGHENESWREQQIGGTR